MALNGTMIRLGFEGFGIECRDTLFNEPVAVRQVWPLESWRVTGSMGMSPDAALGKAATCTDGKVSCYLGNGTWLSGPLPGGGSCKAIITEQTPVPCPKVRAGIQTRWHNGAWQKLLQKGWVNA